MPLDMIYHHEHWQGASLPRFLSDLWVKLSKSSPMPTIERPPASGDGLETVAAYINEGRWVAECPDGCGSAIVVSETDPIYICLSPPYLCPAEKEWFRVAFPRYKKSIEATLLKRPAKRPFYASNRNWCPGESLQQLKAENAAEGII